MSIYLYREPTAKTLCLDEITGYLKEKLGNPNIVMRDDFISHHLNEKSKDGIARELARTKVRNLSGWVESEPLHGEIEYERKILRETKIPSGILYDGFKLQNVLQQLIPEKECNQKDLHIAFTNRLFGTFDTSDGRYHARVIICGNPSLISTSGVVEAPAMPKEFYHYKRQYAMYGIPLEILKEKFKGRFIDYDDPRLTEVMKGYVMQAIFYHFTHEPFCGEKYCRLYNAHWHEEVLEAQLKPPEFCEKHKRMVDKIATEL